MRRIQTCLVPVIAALALAVGPASAVAGAPAPAVVEVGTVDGVLAAASVVGAAARTTFSRSNANFVVTDPGGVTAMSGCDAVSATQVTCAAAGLTSVQFTGRGTGGDLVVTRAGLGVRAILSTGSGADTLVSGAGADNLYGGPGSDILTGNAGGDLLFGGNGNDVVRGGLGNDRLYGGPGDDTLDESVAAGGGGMDNFWGGDGNDTVRAKGDGGVSEHIYGGDGNDTASRDPWDSYWSIEHVF